MNWETLFNKIGNQNLNKMKTTEVIAIIGEKEIPMILKFSSNGTPYFIPKECETQLKI